jgi:hypothetical protein
MPNIFHDSQLARTFLILEYKSFAINMLNKFLTKTLRRRTQIFVNLQIRFFKYSDCKNHKRFSTKLKSAQEADGKTLDLRRELR